MTVFPLVPELEHPHGVPCFLLTPISRPAVGLTFPLLWELCPHLCLYLCVYFYVPATVSALGLSAALSTGLLVALELGDNW